MWNLGRRAPAAAVAVWLLVVLMATGVPLRDVLVYAAYQLGVVVLPGVALYRALCRRADGALRQLAFGWALGLALEVLAFIATAAAGARWTLPWLLACVGLVSWVAWRRDRRPAEPRPPPAWSWAVAAVCVLALAYLAADSFTQEPLPGSEASVVYYPDLVWYVSVAAEARQHWPALDPNVAGESLNYHVFAMYDWAAAARITGVDVATVAFRLFPATMLVALTLLLVAAGSRGAHRWAGPLTALLVLLTWRPDLDLAGADQYVGLVTLSFLSPTFLLGLVFFLPAVMLLAELLDDPGGARSWGRWAALALLLAAAAGTKASILPIVLVGLVVFAGWSLVVRRRVARATFVALAMTAGILAASSVFLYAGRASGFRVEPFSVLSYALPSSAVGLGSRDVGYLAAALPLSLLLLLPLAGSLWVLRRGPVMLSTRHALLLSMLVPALCAYYGLGHDGGSQAYFLVYGYVAAALVSADGLLEAGSAWRRREHVRLPVGVWLAAGSLLALACGVAAAEIAAASGVDLDPSAQIVLACSFAVTALIGLALARRASGKVGAGALAALALGAGAAAVVDSPLDRLPGVGQRWLSAASTVHRPEGGPGGNGMSRELYAGLDWVRRNTKPDALLAVNNYYLDPVSHDPRYVYYSAFAERRIFLEGWGYNARTFDVGFAQVKAGRSTFPRRMAMNDAAIRGDRLALRALAARGVTHLLVDKAHGPAPLEPPGLLVFSNPALEVYELARRPRRIASDA